MPDFAERLNKATQKAIIVEMARRLSQRKTISESRMIQEGPYYWIPTPGGSWEIMSWYVSQLGVDGTDHSRVWADSASHYLAELWGVNQRQISGLWHALPRGRVSRGVGAVYVNHGNDAPVPEEKFKMLVCREFNLTGVLLNNPHKIKWAYDNHERTLGDDTRRLEAVLGAKGYKAVPA